MCFPFISNFIYLFFYSLSPVNIFHKASVVQCAELCLLLLVWKTLSFRSEGRLKWN